MPPKKKGGKKKKGDKKSAGGQAKTPSEEDTGGSGSELPDMLGKDYFVFHIRDLERRVSRYRRKYEALQSSNDIFMDKYKELSQDKKERVSFLKKSLEQQGNELADHKDRLAGLQQAREAEKDHFESQLQELRTQFQEMKDQLTSENNVLTARLASLEEFKIQKEKLWERYHDLEAELAQMITDHEATMSGIGQKTLADRDRLKKEMVLRVNQVAAEFRRVSNKQMEETTKRTIRENVSIQTQLAKMTDKNAELVTENAGLREQARTRAARIRQLERSHNELAKKNSATLKILHMLTERSRELSEEVDVQQSVQRELNRTKEECDSLREEVDDQLAQIELLDIETADLRSAVTLSGDQLNSIRAEIAEARAALVDAVRAVQDLLQYRLVEGAGDEEEMEQMDRLLAALTRDQMMDESDRRHSASSITPSDPERDGKSWHQAGGAVPGSGKGIRPPLAGIVAAPERVILTESELAHRGAIELAKRREGYCVPGCLDLVPLTGEHIPTNLEKSVPINRALRGLNPLPRVGAPHEIPLVTKSIGVQTFSAPRAVFYADDRSRRIPP